MKFAHAFQTEEVDEPDIADSAVALVSMVNDIVLRDICRLADAFLLMFGLIYALHLDYPKELTHTFNFIQKVLWAWKTQSHLSCTQIAESKKNDLLIKE